MIPPNGPVNAPRRWSHSKSRCRPGLCGCSAGSNFDAHQSPDGSLAHSGPKSGEGYHYIAPDETYYQRNWTYNKDGSPTGIIGHGVTAEWDRQRPGQPAITASRAPAEPVTAPDAARVSRPVTIFAISW